MPTLQTAEGSLGGDGNLAVCEGCSDEAGEVVSAGEEPGTESHGGRTEGAEALVEEVEFREVYYSRWGGFDQQVSPRPRVP